MIPERIKKGDKIGIIAPATPVTKEMRERFEKGVSFLESFGFEVVPGKYLFSHTLRYTASPEEKAEDINSLFADPSIRMILAAQGGVTTNACLELLDWKLIRKNPKILLGISDMTVLLNTVYHKTGLVTYHGPDLLWGFGNNPEHYEIREFKEKMLTGESNSLKRKYKWKTVRAGQASGRLIGGNINALQRLAGTPYFPETKGAILFLEALDISPELNHAFFHQFKQMGVFDKISGVIIGYNSGLEEKAYMEQMEITLAMATKDHNFPILKIMEFGHNTSNTIMPVGLKVQMDTKEDEILFMEPMLQPPA